MDSCAKYSQMKTATEYLNIDLLVICKKMWKEDTC